MHTCYMSHYISQRDEVCPVGTTKIIAPHLLLRFTETVKFDDIVTASNHYIRKLNSQKLWNHLAVKVSSMARVLKHKHF